MGIPEYVFEVGDKEDTFLGFPFNIASTLAKILEEITCSLRSRR
jgi:hypothetical protein